MGALLAALDVGIIATLLAWGALADRIGERAVIATGAERGGAGAVADAFADDSAGSSGVGLVVAGAFGSSANAASGRAVVSWFGPTQRGFALGLRHMSTPLGGAIAGGAAAGRGRTPAGSRRRCWRWRRRLAVGSTAAALGPAPPPSRAARRAGPRRPPPPAAGRCATRPSGACPWGRAAVVLAQLSLLSFIALYLHEERGWSVTARPR